MMLRANLNHPVSQATIIEAGSGYTIDSYSIEQLNQAREDHQTDLKVPRAIPTAAQLCCRSLAGQHGTPLHRKKS